MSKRTPGKETPGKKGIATRSVRAGLESDAQHGSVVPPIYLSTNFAFKGYRQPRQYDYTRRAIRLAINWRARSPISRGVPARW